MKSISRHIVFTLLAITILPTVICALNEYQWGTVTNIDIDTQDGHITSQSDVRVGTTTITLDISGDDPEAIITANNLTTEPQLSNGTDTLVTKYKLELDGNGSSKSGGSSMEDYVDYDTFLSGGVNIKYVNNDYDVQVTLSVQASNRPDNVSDSGVYSATQTLTVTWDGE